MPVDDGGVLIDMNDAQDYARVAELVRAERVPAPDECRQLCGQRGVSRAVRAHGEAVARVAHGLGQALNRAGAGSNLKPPNAAALLHDVRREQRHHAAASAAYLTASGLPRVAAVVARHMDVPEPVATIPGEGGGSLSRRQAGA